MPETTLHFDRGQNLLWTAVRTPPRLCRLMGQLRAKEIPLRTSLIRDIRSDPFPQSHAQIYAMVGAMLKCFILVCFVARSGPGTYYTCSRMPRGYSRNLSHELLHNPAYSMRSISSHLEALSIVQVPWVQCAAPPPNRVEGERLIGNRIPPNLLRNSRRF